MKKSSGEAIVLAGGFGTRLRKVVSDVPKPMAPMDDKGTPFLALVMHKLAEQGISRVILSVGYMAEVIQKYFGNTFEGMTIDYVIEDSPLGTGGAVKKALGICNEDNVFVLNGDTFLDVSLAELKQLHEHTNADFTLVAREMSNFDRYGVLALDEANRVLNFGEKEYCMHGYINGGVYCLRRGLIDDMRENVFSLEKDFLEAKVDQLHIHAYKTNSYFIDIGIPADYSRAKLDFVNGEI